MRVRVTILWVDLVRDLGMAVIVAVVLGLIFQHFVGVRVTLWSQIMWALGGIWYGRWLGRWLACRRTSKKREQGIGSTVPNSARPDAKKPREDE